MTPLELATKAHAGQFRRDGVTPYIEHPKAVAAAFEKGSDEEAVAFLHDVLEDTDMTADDLIALGVPDRIVEAVKLLTKPKGENYERYINLLFFGFDSPFSMLARRVKLADIAANLVDAPTDKQRQKYARALQIIAKNF